jgi:hypothetical protein
MGPADYSKAVVEQIKTEEALLRRLGLYKKS